jgi:hypothetical protein
MLAALHGSVARFDLVASRVRLGGALCFARSCAGRTSTGPLVWASLWTLAACLSKDVAFVAPLLYAVLIFFPRRAHR